MTRLRRCSLYAYMNALSIDGCCWLSQNSVSSLLPGRNCASSHRRRSTPQPPVNLTVWSRCSRHFYFVCFLVMLYWAAYSCWRLVETRVISSDLPLQHLRKGVMSSSAAAALRMGCMRRSITWLAPSFVSWTRQTGDLCPTGTVIGSLLAAAAGVDSVDGSARVSVSTFRRTWRSVSESVTVRCVYRTFSNMIRWRRRRNRPARGCLCLTSAATLTLKCFSAPSLLPSASIDRSGRVKVFARLSRSAAKAVWSSMASLGQRCFDVRSSLRTMTSASECDRRISQVTIVIYRSTT